MIVVVRRNTLILKEPVGSTDYDELGALVVSYESSDDSFNPDDLSWKSSDSEDDWWDGGQRGLFHVSQR